jgi:DNA-directed RNA polymerase specialized sigma24 family protein
VTARRLDEEGRAALDRVVRKYHPYLVRYLLCRFRVGQAWAEECANDFAGKKLVEDRLLDGVEHDADSDSPRRFRAFLYTAFRHWAIDALRKEARRGKRFETREDADLDAVFDDNEAEEAWCGTLMAEAVLDLYRETARTKPQHWNVFRARHLLDEPWDVRRCREEFGFDTDGQVHGAAARMRKRLAELVRTRLEEQDQPLEELLEAAGACRQGYLPDLPFVQEGDGPDDSSVPPAALLLPASTRHLAGLLDMGRQLTEALSAAGVLSALRESPPSPERLRGVKDLAKRWDAEKRKLAPGVTSWVYYAALAAALPARIGRLDDAALRKGIEWALRQEWREVALDHVLERGLATLGK